MMYDSYLSAGDVSTINLMYPSSLAALANPVARSANQVDVFTARPDGQIRTAAWDPTIDAPGVYRGWWNLAGGNIGKAGQISAVARTSQRLDPFSVGANGRVYTAAWDQAVDGGNGFRGWWLIGTLVAQQGARVTPVAMASNMIRIFAVAVARNSTAVEIHIMAAGQVYTNERISGSNWQGWHQLPDNI